MNESSESQALVVHQPQPLDVAQAMRIEDILGQVRLIQDVMRRVMVEKEHYGTIPGCGDKKTLLQPGAQKLTMTFRLAPEYNIQEVNLERGHKEYRITCTLKSIQSGSFVGQGVGCCSTMESKYRWRSGSLKCPDCGKETVFKSKKPGEGWYCWSKKGGCGAQFKPDAPGITEQDIGRVENDNPADCYNTVLKIAKKRAFVDATITATAASDIFTQDIGDEESIPVTSARSEYVPEDDNLSFENAPGTTASSKPPQDTTQGNKPRPSDSRAHGKATVAHRLKALNNLQAAPGQEHVGLVEGYLRSKGWIKGEQTAMDFPMEFVPTTKEEMEALSDAVQRFEVNMRSETV